MPGKPTNRTYQFATFQEVVDRVPPDRLADCLRELGEILAITAHTAGLIYSAAGVDRPGRLITLPAAIEWIDDGKSSIGATICNPDGSHLMAAKLRRK